MKTKNVFLILFVLLFYTFSYSQTTPDAKDESPFRLLDGEIITDLQFNYVNDNNRKDFLIIKSPVKNYKKTLKDEQEVWEANKKGDKPLFLDGTLNILFSEKIGAAFGSSNSLSLQKSYFNLDASEKSFSIGYNFDNRRGDALKPLNWVFGIGAKIVASDGFATISTGGDLEENNIGANLKFSFIGDGTIAWSNSKEGKSGYKNHRETIEAYRKFLFRAYDNKVKKYNKDNVPSIAALQKEMKGKDSILVNMKNVMKAKSDELFEEMIRSNTLRR